MALLTLPNEDELDQIEGWLSVDEGRRLAYLASITPAHLAIVELGSWKGKSAAWLASGSRAGHGAHVWAVDHWIGSEEHQQLFWDSNASTLPEFTANLEWLGLSALVTPVTGRTVDVARTWQREVGLLFIDAAHDYQSVKADFLAWSPFVVVGGWLVFHDAGSPGVARVIDESVRWSPEWGGQNTHPPYSVQRFGPPAAGR